MLSHKQLVYLFMTVFMVSMIAVVALAGWLSSDRSIPQPPDYEPVLSDANVAQSQPDNATSTDVEAALVCYEYLLRTEWHIDQYIAHPDDPEVLELASIALGIARMTAQTPEQEQAVSQMTAILARVRALGKR